MSVHFTRRRTALVTATLAAAAALSLAAGGSGQAAPRSAVAKKAAATVTCTGADTKVTAQPVTRPLNHLLLTVTNTGTKACDLYGYPALQFTGAQAVPPVIEESQPQAVVTLAPGKSGYAGVTLSSADGSGEGGYTAKTLRIYFQNRDLEFPGTGTKVALPAKGVYIDSTLRVTYWQSDAASALTW
ncbi:DUF4232 domain-containing protein [Streptomyces sp. NPDC007851]|uniref:DUF4232 domain-containing protein n=1 Tax=Streptomyces sp. NPDC007851 TaxID=3155008 RepID=UPI0033DA7F20